MRKLRLPGINAPTTAGKVEQLRSYLYQLADQLNQILDTQSTGTVQVRTEEPETLFARIKPLILRSADITNAIASKLKNTFVQTSQLEDGQFALQGSLNGLHIHTAAADENCRLRITTNLSSFLEGGGSQLFFIFGTDGGVPVHMVLRADRDGTLECDRAADITADPDTGQVYITTAHPADQLTVLSPAPFTLT